MKPPEYNEIKGERRMSDDKTWTAALLNVYLAYPYATSLTDVQETSIPTNKTL